MNPSSDNGRMAQTRALFDAQVDALDGATATALRARRRDALATAPRHRRAAWWWPASGVATAALAVVLWLPRTDGPMADSMPAPMAGVGEPASPPETVTVESRTTEAARLADNALVEFEEDAEFYAWLATVPDDTGSPIDTSVLPDAGPHEGLTL